MPDDPPDDAPGHRPEEDPQARLERQRRQQGGAFTRRQALAAGHSPVDVAARLRRGTWLALERGAYVRAADLDPGEPHAEHALRVAARSLALGGGHVACRRSASLVLGLPLLGPVPAPPEVVRAPRRPGDRSSSPSVKVAALEPADVVRWRGVTCTAPARLVCDLARTHGQVEALAVADASLRAGLGRELLTEAAQRCAGWPGAGAVAEVLRCCDGRVDSPLESLTRWVLHRLGLPPPLSQVDVWRHGRFLGRVDFAWPALGVVLEADGMAKYQGGALLAEKRRELELRRAGLEVVRTTWDDATSHQDRMAAEWRTHAALAAARADERRDTVLRPALLDRTGPAGIPVPSRAARPLVRARPACLV